jgi:hypothetical protein
MPWAPELFSAPALEQLLMKRRRDKLPAVPYFDGLMAGEPDALVESFAGSANHLTSALQRAAAAHGEHEKRISGADPNWPDWDAGYMVREQAGAEPPS